MNRQNKDTEGFKLESNRKETYGMTQSKMVQPDTQSEERAGNKRKKR
jgi:hypothetical protein